MSEQFEVDPEKVVHEENYKVNLGDEGQEELILPTQLNTEENNIIAQPIGVVETKQIMTENIKTGYINNRVIITETATNIQCNPTAGILDGNISIDSLNAVPQLNRTKGDNPYEIPEEKKACCVNKAKEKEQPEFKEKIIKHSGDPDYLKREMVRECKDSRFNCNSCNLL